jgi:four helix bundle protein
VNLISRFEDLIAWQKARLLTAQIYEITQTKNFTSDRPFVSQIRRATVSIMSNVAEGHERANPREFQYFLLVAKGSCAEVRSQLYVALDAKFVNEQQFKTLLTLNEEVGRLIGGLRSSIIKRLRNTS